MDVLSHPFRIGHNGSAAKVREGSTEANAEAVAVTVLTLKGERPMVPTFGVTGPPFDGVDLAEVNACLATFGPDVRVEGIDVAYVDNRTELVTLELVEA